MKAFLGASKNTTSDWSNLRNAPLLTSVDEHVSLVVAALIETFATVITLVRPNTIMKHHVGTQVTASLKSLKDRDILKEYSIMQCCS